MVNKVDVVEGVDVAFVEGMYGTGLEVPILITNVVWLGVVDVVSTADVLNVPVMLNLLDVVFTAGAYDTAFVVSILTSGTAWLDVANKVDVVDVLDTLGMLDVLDGVDRVDVVFIAGTYETGVDVSILITDAA